MSAVVVANLYSGTAGAVEPGDGESRLAKGVSRPHTGDKAGGCRATIGIRIAEGLVVVVDAQQDLVGGPGVERGVKSDRYVVDALAGDLVVPGVLAGAERGRLLAFAPVPAFGDVVLRAQP